MMWRVILLGTKEGQKTIDEPQAATSGHRREGCDCDMSSRKLKRFLHCLVRVSTSLGTMVFISCRVPNRGTDRLTGGQMNRSNIPRR